MNTFPFFPVPASGETVYSLFGRCIARAGFPETLLLQELTGQRHATTLLSALPGYLSSISGIMPYGHPWRDPTLIVREHTSLPYFTYFDERQDRDRWVDTLAQTDSSKPIVMALGLTSYSRGMIPIHPRYCPTCAQTDPYTYGFPWFRREHQLPGVAVCWQHGKALAQGCSRCGPYPIKGKALSMAGRCLCDEGTTSLPVQIHLPEDIEPLVWLARQSAFMVNSLGSPIGGTRATLREKVLEQGFGRGSLIEPHRLAKAIEERFGRQTLESLGTPAWEEGRPAAWLRRLLSGQLDGKKRSPALLFLLVIGTLYESVEAFERTAEVPICLLGAREEELVRPIWSEELFNLLKTCDCGLPGISKKLGISIYRLIEEIRQRAYSGESGQ